MKSLPFNRSLLTVTLALCGLFAYSFSGAQNWTAPTENPPDGNVPAPINVGTTAQVKQGTLGVNILATATTTGAVWSDRYCDALGQNCFTATSSPSGGGGWQDVSLAGSELFDVNCDYRALVNNGYLSGPHWYSITGISEQDLIYIAHNSVISHIRHDSKNTYRVNNAPRLTVFEIQRRCGG